MPLTSCVGGVLNPRMLAPSFEFVETMQTISRSDADPSLPATGRTWAVPRWIIVGILSRETRSYLRSGDMSVRYVDQRRSTTGARGPTQITSDTFADYRKKGELYSHLETDMNLALDVTQRILVAHRAALGSWERAIRAYVAGKGNWRCDEARRYYEDVKALGHEPERRK